MIGEQDEPKKPEIREPEVIESWGNPLAALNRVEIDIQIATAKRWPRSIGRFKELVRTLATLDEETAGSMFYALPREGRTIDGPSIRFAEIVGSAWTNLRYGGRIMGIDERHVTAQGAAFDLENNLACTVEVKRRITDKHNRRYSDDMITTTSQAAISIALRNAIFRVVPFALIKDVYEEARTASIGKGKTMAQRRQLAADTFAKWGVAPDKMCAVAGKASLDDLDDEALIKLRGIVTAIRDGETTIDEVLREVLAPTTEEKSNEAKGKLTTLTEKLETAQDRRSPGGPVPSPPPPLESPAAVPQGTPEVKSEPKAVEPPPETGAPLDAGGPSPERDAVLMDITALMAEIRPTPEEEQWMWGKYGGGMGEPAPIERLVAMRTYLQGVLAAVAAKRPAARKK